MIRDEARQVALMQAIHTDEQHMVDARLLGADGWGQESCGQRHRDHDSGEGLHATSDGRIAVGNYPLGEVVWVPMQ